jgi:hypothetical protein
MMEDKCPMIFRKLGGRYQLMIDSPAVLKSICDLDEALWMCTGAPIDSFTCDPVFLKYLDSDSNGRVRTDEVKLALKWLLNVISDLTVLSSDLQEFPLDAINTQNDAGKQLRLSAERILSNLGLQDSKIIKLEHTQNRQKILSSGECNGDGVIPVTSVTKKELQSFINDIMVTVGETTDAGGQKGINSEHLDTFIKDASAYLEWYEKGKLKHGQKSSGVMVWGDDTVTAYTALKGVKNKIDEYFSQCRLLAVDPVSADRFYADEKTIINLDTSDTDAINQHILKAPLSKPNVNEILHLDKNINPAYRPLIVSFRECVLKKSKSLKSDSTLTFDEWEALKKEFANFAEWESGKPGETVEKLGVDLLKKYTEGNFESDLRPIFEKDLTVADEIKKIGEVEKLILYCRYLLKFTNNFISFSSLFDPEDISMIQVGKLIMDARHFDLNVKVKDIKQHKKIAARSNICVMYLKLTAKDGETVLSTNVATAVTSGNILNLYIGKRGVFFTPDGKEWDAEVIDFIQQPVSISEALKMPFTKLGKFLKKQTDKFKTSTYSKLESGVGSGVTNATKAIQAPPQNQTQNKTSWTGPMMLLGGGIGLAGVGSAFASVMNALKNDTVIIKIALFLVGLIIILAIPIIISAMLKLRRRNVGMFLEACGWSINTSMRLNLKMGLLFTRTPAFPENSRKKMFDYTSFFLKKINFQKKSWKYKLTLIIICIMISVATGFAVNKIWKVDQKISNWLGVSEEIEITR